MQVCRWLLACGASASVEAPPRASARHCCSPAGPASVPSTLGSSGGKPRCAGLKDTGPNAGRVGKRGFSSCRHQGWTNLQHPRVGSTSIAKQRCFDGLQGNGKAVEKPQTTYYGRELCGAVVGSLGGCTSIT